MTERTRKVRYAIPGETPAQKNEVRFARGRTYKSDRFREWRESTLWELRSQGLPGLRIGIQGSAGFPGDSGDRKMLHHLLDGDEQGAGTAVRTRKVLKFGSASCFFAGFCGKPHRYAVSRLSKC